jgi:hypothetical protein
MCHWPGVDRESLDTNSDADRIDVLFRAPNVPKVVHQQLWETSKAASKLAFPFSHESGIAMQTIILSLVET